MQTIDPPIALLVQSRQELISFMYTAPRSSRHPARARVRSLASERPPFRATHFQAGLAATL